MVRARRRGAQRPGALPERAEDRRARDQPPLRGRRARHGRDPRRRPHRRGCHRQRAAHRGDPAEARGGGASAAGGGAGRGVHAHQGLRGAERPAGRAARARRGRVPRPLGGAQHHRHPRLRRGPRDARRDPPLPHLRQPPQHRRGRSAPAAGEEGGPRARGRGGAPGLAAPDRPRPRRLAGPARRLPVRDVRAAEVLGPAHQRPPRRRRHGRRGRRLRRAPRGAPPRPRARDRRDRRQGGLLRAAAGAGLHLPRPALGDRGEVPARGGHHQAAGHPGAGGPHRPRHPLRDHGARAGRGLHRREGDVAQPVRRRAQGRADRRHDRAAQGRGRDPRDPRPGRVAARRHRAPLRHADGVPRLRHRDPTREGGGQGLALPEPPQLPRPGHRPGRARRLPRRLRHRVARRGERDRADRPGQAPPRGARGACRGPRGLPPDPRRLRHRARRLRGRQERRRGPGHRRGAAAAHHLGGRPAAARRAGARDRHRRGPLRPHRRRARRRVRVAAGAA